MIGIAIGKLPKLTFDWTLIGVLFFIKFFVWPALVSVIVAIDIFVLHLFDSQVHQIMLFFSVMPLIGNLVAYAAEHNLHPEKTAAAVLASSLVTIIIVPLAYALMIWAGV